MVIEWNGESCAKRSERIVSAPLGARLSCQHIGIIAKKRLNLPASPQLLLNIFEVNMFEKIPLDQLVTDTILNFDDHPLSNQLFLL